MRLAGHARGPWLHVGLVALLLSIVAACSDAEGDGAAAEGGVEHRILAAGHGHTNTEPLWPMRVGTRHRFAEGEWVVARRSDRHGPAWVLEQASGSPHPLATWFGRNQGRAEAFWSIDKEGLVLRAHGSQLALDVPRLVVPATVRRGMKWQTRSAAGEVLLSGEIGAGDNRDTPFGRRRVWTLRIDVPNRGKWQQDFIEGRGPVGTAFSLVPLEERSEPLPPRVALKASGIQPLEVRAGAESFSVIEDPLTGRPEAHLGVYVPGAPKENVGIHGLYYRRYPNRRMCYVTEGQKLVPLDPKLSKEYGFPHDYALGPCQDAAGVVFLPGAKRARIPLSSQGWSFGGWPDAPYCWAVPGLHCPIEPLFPNRVRGAFAHGGAAMALVDHSTYGAGTGAFILDYANFVSSESHPFWAAVQNPANHSLTATWGPWLRPLGATQAQRIVALGPASDAGMGLLFHAAGQVGHAEVRRREGHDLRIELVPWAASATGVDFADLNRIVTVLHGDNTRDLYELAEDGLLWKLDLEAGVLQRTQLAALKLPAGHHLIGVVPTAPGRMQIWTQDGMAFAWDALVQGAGLVYYWIENARQHVWDLQLDPAAPPQAPVLWQGLQVSAAGRDVLMCAPRGRQLPDTPWLLGGQPTRILRQDPRCLLLIRPYLPGATPVEPPDEHRSVPPPLPDHWLLQGSLPDLGPVEIAIQPGQGQPIEGIEQARKGGGFEGPGLLAGPGFGQLEVMGTVPGQKAAASPAAKGDFSAWPVKLSFAAGRGWLWRTDHVSGKSAGVQLPRAERFAWLEALHGACAADGACFLAVIGAANPEAPRRWSILRVDRVGSGLREVAWGWVDDLGPVAGLLADDLSLVLHDGSHVLWRGLRDMEPQSCPDCSPEEQCLSGFCPCTFGQITLDGLCADQAGSAVYASCKEAAAAGVAKGQVVRLDGDGAGPSPQVLTRCQEPLEWSPMPVHFEPASTVAFSHPGCDASLPPPKDALWYHATSAAGLHGEFEVDFAFGGPVKGAGQHPLLVMAPTKDLSATGTLPSLCAFVASEPDKLIAALGPDQLAVGWAGELYVATKANGQVKLGLWQPGPLWLRRDAAGTVRLGQGTQTLWTSPQPYKRDARLIKVESMPVTLQAIRWKGTTPEFCVPACSGLECGPDGCGGTCGSCIAEAHCETGQCVCNPPLFGDGEKCAVPLGTEQFPAESCAAATAMVFPWSASPWIDPDGPGGEPAWQQKTCLDWQPWTESPTTFLGTQAVLTWSPATKLCQAWEKLAGPPPSPLGILSGSGKLDGALVPAGLTAAATWRAFGSQSFSMMAQLSLGSGGQGARLHLDALGHFAADTAAWTGWQPACGQSVDTAQRFTLRRDAQGLWASVGNAAPQLILPPEKAGTMVTVERTDGGTLRVTGGGKPAFFEYAGPLPAKVRAVAEVDGGGTAAVTLAVLKWK